MNFIDIEVNLYELGQNYLVHRVIIPRSLASQENGKKVMQFFPTAVSNFTAGRHSRLPAHWLMALVWGGGGAWGRSMYSAFPGNCYLSYVGGTYGGENSLHWKANMPLYLLLWLCDMEFWKCRQIEKKITLIINDSIHVCLTLVWNFNILIKDYVYTHFVFSYLFLLF